MSLARLVPISLEKKSEAKKFEIILDYVGGYVYYKDINGDVLPVKANDNDRVEKFMNAHSKLINSKYNGGTIDDGYYSATSTSNSEYLRPIIETDDNTSIYDSNIEQIMARLNKQGANNYEKDVNHFIVEKGAINIKDAKYNASKGESLNALALLFPLGILSNILYEESTPETGTVYKDFQTLIFKMIDDISKRKLITDYNTEMLQYITKGLAAYDSTAPYSSYLTVKSIVDAVEDRYNKAATDKKFLAKGTSAQDIDTFDASPNYNNYRSAKNIADVIINLIKYHIPTALSEAELTDYNSKVPYTSYKSIKSIIDALIPKGSGWDETKEPYKSLNTIKLIADAIADRYTKKQVDDGFINTTDGIKKGLTAVEINNYNTIAPYTNYSTLKLIVDAIESRYTKTETDELLADKFPIAVTKETATTFATEAKYAPLRNARDMAEFLLAFRGMSYIKDEIDIKDSTKLDKGGTLPSGYETALLLANRVIELESNLLSSKMPIKLELVGVGFGQVYGVRDDTVFMVSDYNTVVPDRQIYTTAQRLENVRTFILNFFKHHGDVAYLQWGNVPENLSGDGPYLDKDYIAVHPFYEAWSGATDLKYYGNMSHAQPHSDTLFDGTTGNSRPIVLTMNNDVCEQVYIIESWGAGDSNLPTIMMTTTCGVGSGSQKEVLPVSCTNVFRADVYDTTIHSGINNRKLAVIRLGDYGITKSADEKFIQTVRCMSKVVYYWLTKDGSGTKDLHKYVILSGGDTSLAPMAGGSVTIQVYDNDGTLYKSSKIKVSTTNSTNIEYTTDASGKATVNVSNNSYGTSLASACLTGVTLVNPSALYSNIRTYSFPSLSCIKESELKYFESIYSNEDVVSVSAVEYAGYNGVYFNFINYGSVIKAVGSLSFNEDIFAEGYAGLTEADRELCKLVYVDMVEVTPMEYKTRADLYYYHTRTKKFYRARYKIGHTHGAGLLLGAPYWANDNGAVQVERTIATGTVTFEYAVQILLDGNVKTDLTPIIQCNLANVSVEYAGAFTANGAAKLYINNHSGSDLRLYADILSNCEIMNDTEVSTITTSATIEVDVVGATGMPLKFVETDYHLEKQINGNIYNIPDNLVNPYTQGAGSRAHKVYRITKDF